MLFTGLSRSVLGKTVPSVSSTVFPNTDRLRPVNNIYIYQFRQEYKAICIGNRSVRETIRD